MAPPPASTATAVTPNESSKAPPPSNETSPIVSLVIRILAFICLFISLILLTTASFESPSGYGYGWDRNTFTFFRAFRYLCATVVLGLAYTLLQTAFTIFQVTTGNRIAIDSLNYIVFYGDKVVSYVLATGAAASFGMTQDLKRLAPGSGSTKFIKTTDAATSLCLLAFLFTAISSVFSSFALPKRA